MPVNLNEKTIHEILLTAQQISYIENLEHFRKELLFLLKKLLSFEKGNFYSIAGCSNTNIPFSLNSGNSDGLSGRFLRLFSQYYHQLDPFMDLMRRTNLPPSVVTFEQIIPFDELIKTEYYIDFLEPQSIHDQMGISLVSGNRLLGVIALFRSNCSPGFSSIDRAIAEMIAPFITSALDRVSAKQKNQVLEQTFLSLLVDRPCQGAIVLDKSLTPVFSSENLHSLVSSLNRKVNPDRPLKSNLPKKLRVVCADVLSGPMSSNENNDKYHRVELSTDKKKGKNVVQVKKIYLNNGEPFILLSINPDGQNTATSNLLKKMGISAREMDIINHLFNGKRNSEIGKELFISEHTVENHLRSIYRKMQVRNRTALVSKIINTSIIN